MPKVTINPFYILQATFKCFDTSPLNIIMSKFALFQTKANLRRLLRITLREESQLPALTPKDAIPKRDVRPMSGDDSLEITKVSSVGVVLGKSTSKDDNLTANVADIIPDHPIPKVVAVGSPKLEVAHDQAGYQKPLRIIESEATCDREYYEKRLSEMESKATCKRQEY